MRHKWASCCAFQDYVIVHELLHLRIRNHGKLYMATLRAHLPGNRWLRAGSSRVPHRRGRP
jgi:predicted metal-dependent hydrolase